MHFICDLEVKGHKIFNIKAKGHMGQGQRSHWSRSYKDPKQKQVGSQQCHVASFTSCISRRCNFIGPVCLVWVCGTYIVHQCEGVLRGVKNYVFLVNDGAQHRSVLDNTALYCRSGAQRKFHKPMWTDRQTLPNILSPCYVVDKKTWEMRRSSLSLREGRN